MAAFKWNKSKMLEAINKGYGNVSAGAIVEKAVYTIWLGQTEDEKNAADVRHDNNKGLATSTRYWGSFIGRILQQAVAAKGGNLSLVPWGKILYTTKMQDKAIGIARFHAAQVAKRWNVLLAEKKAA
jgi:hypothetical protein